jgi:hypothetical protein
MVADPHPLTGGPRRALRCHPARLSLALLRNVSTCSLDAPPSVSARAAAHQPAPPRPRRPAGRRPARRRRRAGEARACRARAHATSAGANAARAVATMDLPRGAALPSRASPPSDSPGAEHHGSWAAASSGSRPSSLTGACPAARGSGTAADWREPNAAARTAEPKARRELGTALAEWPHEGRWRIRDLRQA